MRHAIEVLERELRACKGAKAIDDRYNRGKQSDRWVKEIKQLEAAIAKLKSDDTATKRYIEKLEDACCDCAEFEEFGYHDKNCFVMRIKS